ncbi:MAG TPA: hypothetical protein VI072_10125 [Polyangiaceae bacterium]
MLGFIGRTRASRRSSVVLACSALLTACSDDDRPGAWQSPICDIRFAGCQQAVFASTASLRGQRGEALPRVRTRTLAEIEEEFRSGGELQLDAEASAWWRAQSLLRLVPPGQEASEVSLQNFLDNAGAYYDPSNKQITIIDRGTAGDATQSSFLLSHEFVHALQDRDVDLRALSERWVTSTDSSAAVGALVEGEATVLANVVIARAMGFDAADVDWISYTGEFLASVLSAAAASDAPLLAAAQLFVYPVGTAYLADRYIAEGQSVISQLYSQPPLSFVEWTSGAWARPSAEPQPLDCFPTTAPAGYRGLDHDVLGQVGVFAAQTALGDAVSAWETSKGTRGDSVVLFVQDGDLNENTPVALAWRIVFDSANEAQNFRSAAEGQISPARVEVAAEREVLIRAATDPSILDGWTLGCGRADELPRPPEAQALRVASRFRRALWGSRLLPD